MSLQELICSYFQFKIKFSFLLENATSKTHSLFITLKQILAYIYI